MTRRVLLALALVAAAGCVYVGPQAIRQARFDYNQAVVRTYDEQLLLNLVRLHYRDTPYFLEVSNISTQYELEGRASAGVSLADDDVVDIGAGINYVERPTIVYTPLAGAGFARRLLTPLSPESLFLLTGAGWRTDRVLRCGVVRINDVWNAPEASGPTPELAPEYEDFRTVARLLSELKTRRSLSLGYRSAGPDGRLVLQFDAASVGSDERRRLNDLLGLDAQARELEFGRDLKVVTRSLMGVMYYLSQAVEAPERDREAGRVTVTRSADGEEFPWSRMLGDLLAIHSSAERPEGAFVRVRYRDTWFFIDDADLSSKSTFSLLGQLFNLQAGETPGERPILTLPLSG